MVWTKICGIRDVETARAIAALQPSAIGLNFFPRSVRCLSPSQAAEIHEAVSDQLETVALFVNAQPHEILDVRAEVAFHVLQLHGDESPETLATIHRECPELKLIRAFRIDSSGLAPVEQYLDRCRELQVPLYACLVDAFVPGEFGGTGKKAPWNLLADEYPKSWPPLVLAGGLTAENVAAAIETVHPWGIDVASGVESVPGIKDLEQVARFLSAIHEA